MNFLTHFLGFLNLPFSPPLSHDMPYFYYEHRPSERDREGRAPARQRRRQLHPRRRCSPDFPDDYYSSYSSPDSFYSAEGDRRYVNTTSRRSRRPFHREVCYVTEPNYRRPNNRHFGTRWTSPPPRTASSAPVRQYRVSFPPLEHQSKDYYRSLSSRRVDYLPSRRGHDLQQ